jgi:hypothetical protein
MNTENLRLKNEKLRYPFGIEINFIFQFAELKKPLLFIIHFSVFSFQYIAAWDRPAGDCGRQSAVPTPANRTSDVYREVR